MAQIAYVAVPENWVLLSDLVTDIEDGDTYMIESKGPGNVLIRESDSLPSNDDYGGVILDKYSYKIALYANNELNLYVRLERVSLPASINVTSVYVED